MFLILNSMLQSRSYPSALLISHLYSDSMESLVNTLHLQKTESGQTIPTEDTKPISEQISTCVTVQSVTMDNKGYRRKEHRRRESLQRASPTPNTLYFRCSLTLTLAVGLKYVDGPFFYEL